MTPPVFPAVKAGRAFKNAFDSLETADRARLRRADDPQTVSAFWRCFDAARREHKKAYPSLYAQTVPLLDLVTQPLPEALAKRDEKDQPLNLGRFLAAHKSRINLRRVEALFSEDHLDALIDGLDSVFGITKGEPIDMGVLIRDLDQFTYSVEARARIRQRWARDYFSTKPNAK